MMNWHLWTMSVINYSFLPGYMVLIAPILEGLIFQHLLTFKMPLFILFSFREDGLDLFYELSPFLFIKVFIVHNNTAGWTVKNLINLCNYSIKQDKEYQNNPETTEKCPSQLIIITQKKVLIWFLSPWTNFIIF